MCLPCNRCRPAPHLPGRLRPHVDRSAVTARARGGLEARAPSPGLPAPTCLPRVCPSPATHLPHGEQTGRARPAGPPGHRAPCADIYPRRPTTALMNVDRLMRGQTTPSQTSGPIRQASLASPLPAHSRSQVSSLMRAPSLGAGDLSNARRLCTPVGQEGGGHGLALHPPHPTARG